jgi:two-component system nitrogen regulation sensor histidine kinase NtrY
MASPQLQSTFSFLKAFFLVQKVKRVLAFLLTLCAIVLGIVTYAVLTGQGFFVLKAKTVIWLLVIDFTVLSLLCVVVARKIIKVWFDYKHGVTRSRLHVKLSVFFGLLAIFPTILMAIFSTLFFHYGLHTWFSDQVKKGLDESLSVAQSYLEEHQQVVTRDARIMSQDIVSNSEIFNHAQEEIDNFLSLMANIRNMTEAIVLDEGSNILGRTNFTIALGFEILPDEALSQADKGDVALFTSKTQDRIRALVKISDSPKRYLYVGRFVDPKVLEHLKTTERIVKTHRNLELSHEKFELTFVLIYVVVGLLLLLAAIWVGLLVATQIARPIENLIVAVDAMAQGQLTVRVDTSDKNDELAILSRSFNNMADKLSAQQTALTRVNAALEEKSRFVESVLAGVSVGILSLSSSKRIKLANEAACLLLKKSRQDLNDKPLQQVEPIFTALLEEVEEAGEIMVEKEVQLLVGGELCTFLVKVLVSKDQGELRYIITFDDISSLIYAQQRLAWSDVARRIAHEVKNPLTPIQLSTERIQKKYLAHIPPEEQTTFKEATHTILKYVEQIRSLINEFSSFARMPAPRMGQLDLSKLSAEIITLEKEAFPDITFTFESSQKGVFLVGDDLQLRQVLTNLILNAVESIKEKNPAHPLIVLVLEQQRQEIILTLRDNGMGLPANVVQSELLKPYVTFKQEGTGLGLAIVKKIVDDHHGILSLENHPEGGAIVTLRFPQIKGSQKNGL